MNKQINGLALLALAGASIMSSCSKDTDLYDSNLAQKEYEQNWTEKFGQVASDQDWNLATRATATMSITEDALSKYNLQLFTANPLYDEDARIIANYEVETDANGYATVTFNCDIAKSTTQLYAVRMDSHNRRAVQLVDVTNGAINASFGTSDATKAGTRASVTSTSMEETKKDCPYTESQINAMLDGASELGTLTKDHLTTKLKVTTNTTWSDVLNTYAGAYGNKTLVIDNGATLTLTGSNAGKINGCDIIVKNGTLDVTKATGGEGNSALMIDGGTNLVILQNGKLVFDQEIAPSTTLYGLSLNTGYLYNAGTVTTGNIILNGADWQTYKGTLYNAGTINAGQIELVDAGTTLTNWGKIYCDAVYNKEDPDGNHQAGLGTVNNNCYLYVKNDFCAAVLNEGSNSALEVNVMQINGTWTVRENTILRAEDGRFAGNENGKALIKYCGASGEKALVSFTTITYINDAEISVNVLLETNTAIKTATEKGRTYTGNSAHNFLNNYSSVGEANITIPAGDCTGSGNTPKTKEEIPDPTPTYKSNSWIIACEDLGSTDDYDFNDIVFAVSHVAGKNTATITPLAAGGTLKAKIYNGTTLVGEIHELLGNATTDADGLYQMLNTSTKKSGYYGIVDRSNLPYSASAKTVTLGVDADFTMSNVGHGSSSNMGGFWIKVYKNGTLNESETINAPTTGTVPQMLCIPDYDGWEWPTERTGIEKAYEGFTYWVGDTGVDAWYTTPKVAE